MISLRNLLLNFHDTKYDIKIRIFVKMAHWEAKMLSYLAVSELRLTITLSRLFVGTPSNRASPANRTEIATAPMLVESAKEVLHTPLLFSRTQKLNK